ncbi:MAG: UbiA family prenyltransferase [Chitinophagales bacterium]|nr:UbiA family prenyltransferase [Chitinophagales bacterium]
MKNYLSLVKFSHTIFAMPFAMIGFTLGLYYSIIYDPTIRENSNSYYLLKFILVLVCMITARNAAMAFNRWADRQQDALNPRTAIREIPSGIISEKNALVFVVINCVVFIISTFFINRLCFYLSPIALLVVLGYSYTKRFSFLCHLILGIGLGLAPVGAFVAVTGKFGIVPVLLGIVVMLWVSGFDIIYSLQDEQFDKDNNFFSIPAKFGYQNAVSISVILHIFVIGLLVFIGVFGNFGLLYWIGTVVFACLLIYQHVVVQKFGLERINLAFFTLNGLASILFGMLVITDIIMKLTLIR